MIVKNEEKNIERALSWGKGIVSEQIVVDTGSTDHTVEIAEKIGATVYYFPWVNDFSAAKNFAINKAKYEWIAFLDADEYFSMQEAKKLLPLLKKLQGTSYDGMVTRLINLEDNGNVITMDAQLRIFRNCPGLRYQGRVHESLVWNDGHKVSYWKEAESLSIFHTGYGKEASEKKRKGGRNLKLIQAELEDDPENFEMLAYLGNEYVALQKYDLAEDAYRKAISFIPKWMSGIYHVASSGVYLRLIALLTSQMDIDIIDLENLYHEAIAGWPEEGDYDYLLGNYYARRGDYKKAETHIRKALEIMEKYGNYQKSMLISGKILKVYELLAVCCFNNGNLAETVRLATALLKENHYLMSILTLFILAFRRDKDQYGKEKEGAQQVVALLGRSFYDFSSLKDRLFVLRASEAAGYEELTEVLRGLFSEEELCEIDRAVLRKGTREP